MPEIEMITRTELHAPPAAVASGLLTEPWFTPAEHRQRLSAVRAALAGQDLDGVVLFQPETITWLTGYFTRAYGTFQFSTFRLDADPVVFCRDAEIFYHQRTSAFPERRTWGDEDDAFGRGLDVIREIVGNGKRLGVDLSAWPLNAARYRRLVDAFGADQIVDVSLAMARLRFIKSPAEIALMRRAGRAAEAGMAAAIATVRAGVTERDLAAAVCDALVRGGSDLPGPGVLSSGENALHLHGSYTDRVFATGDTVQLETLPCVRHYHARFMRPIKVGRATPEERTLVRGLVEAQDEALALVKPGTPARVPDAAYRDGLIRRGVVRSYARKTFYSIGLLLAPSGGEPLEAHPSADWAFEPGMTLHTYLLVQGFGMSETIVVTESGYERLTNFDRRLFVTEN